MFEFMKRSEIVKFVQIFANFMRIIAKFISPMYISTVQHLTIKFTIFVSRKKEKNI